MITLKMMPPLMFGGLILAMLIGFPVAFTLAALGLSFGFLSIYLGFFDMNFLQAIPADGRLYSYDIDADSIKRAKTEADTAENNCRQPGRPQAERQGTAASRRPPRGPASLR